MGVLQYGRLGGADYPSMRTPLGISRPRQSTEAYAGRRGIAAYRPW
jgi:hypothetical protein